MKCPACGRTMVERGTLAECPNILCDYDEEIEDREAFRPGRELPEVMVASLVTTPCKAA